MFSIYINHAIDSLAYEKFIDDEIKVKLINEGNKYELEFAAKFFLSDQLNLWPKPFETIQDQSWKNWLFGNIWNFCLVKNKLTSIDNEVNLEFIVRMKKATACFLKCLSKNWVELERSESLVIIQNKCSKAEKISSPDCNLKFILDNYKLLNRVKICALPQGVKVEIHPDYLSEFYAVLKEEAIQAHTFPATLMFMCAKNDPVWMEKYQLPIDVFKLIVRLNSSLKFTFPTKKLTI